MCEIRGAGVMGKGVFANQSIPRGTIIGEYLGRLYPSKVLPLSDRYIFVISEHCEVTANELGNLTRFVNHHCHPNVTAGLGMYGKRQVIMYTANRAIKAGEQLFVDYGEVYFTRPNNLCKCDAMAGDHLPSDAQLYTRSMDGAEELKQSREARQARAERRAAASEKAQAELALEFLAKSSRKSRKTTESAPEKQSSKKPTALRTLTRSAGICKRCCPKHCPKASPSL